LPVAPMALAADNSHYWQFSVNNGIKRAGVVRLRPSLMDFSHHIVLVAHAFLLSSLSPSNRGGVIVLARVPSPFPHIAESAKGLEIGNRVASSPAIRTNVVYL
jgi:hypothetical protein